MVQVRGSSISSKLPYGALSVLLNDLDASHLEHPLMVLRGLTQLLHTKSRGGGWFFSSTTPMTSTSSRA